MVLSFIKINKGKLVATGDFKFMADLLFWGKTLLL